MPLAIFVPLFYSQQNNRSNASNDTSNYKINNTNDCDEIYNKYMECMKNSSTVKCKDLYSQYKRCLK